MHHDPGGGEGSVFPCTLLGRDIETGAVVPTVVVAVVVHVPRVKGVSGPVVLGRHVVHAVRGIAVFPSVGNAVTVGIGVGRISDTAQAAVEVPAFEFVDFLHPFHRLLTLLDEVLIQGLLGLKRGEPEFFLIRRHRILAEIDDAHVGRNGVPSEEFPPRSGFPFSKVAERFICVNLAVAVAIKAVLIGIKVHIAIDKRVDGPSVFIQIPRREPVLKAVVHAVAVGISDRGVRHAEHDLNEGIGRLALLPRVEIVQQSLSTRFLGDEDVKHTLCLLGRLLEITVDVQ